MTAENLIGIIAAICTTIAFIPQVHHIIKTRHTGDISLLMYIIFSFGILLWLIYGFMKADIPLIAANSVTLSLALVILTLKLRWG